MRKSLLFFLILLTFVGCGPFVGCRSNRPVQPPLSRAVFTSDGSAIVFSVRQARTCFLYKADITGGAMHRLTHATSGCESDPAMSPDGKQLVFTRAAGPGEHAALIVANADGTGERTLVSSEEDNLQPIFVPHASQIIFLRSGAFEHHSPLVDNRRHKFDIFFADLVTGQVSAFTHQQFYEINCISISADGRQLVTSLSTYPEGDRFIITPIDEPPGEHTPGPQPVVPNAPTPPPPVYNALWLPDGRSLLFYAASLPPGGATFDYNVYRLNLSSRTIEQLTHLTGQLWGLSVSPDGKRAVFLHDEMYSILNLNTQQITPVPLQMPR